MTQKPTPVVLLTGYLGSGKTTLLNRILSNRRGIRFAVIVNDIGEVNIDAALIQKGGIVGSPENPDDLVALQNGCICCTLKSDLMLQVSQLVASRKFDYIVIEASGVCEPEPIAQTLCTMERMAAGSSDHNAARLDCIVTVVDALRMQSEFDCGEKLRRNDIEEDDIENLIIQQIEFCNIVVLNKISEVSPEEAGRLRTIIRTLQPEAEIIETDFADIDLAKILDTGLFDFDKVATSARWIKEIESPHDDHEEHGHHHHHHEHEHHENEDDHDHHHHDHHHDHDCDHDCHHHHHHHGEGEAEEYGIGTFVYYRRKPFDLDMFDYVAGRKWPKEIIRTKGLVYFSNNRDMSYLFEQAGVQKRLTQAGLWFATAPEEDLEALKLENPDMMRDWDAEYGDRMIKLVIIGQHLDRERITALLDSCLADS